MSKLEKIEELRRKFVQEIMEITGLPVDDISVDVSFTGTDENTLLVEAKDLNWHTAQYGEAEWYTSERPAGGAVTVYMESPEPENEPTL